MNNQPEIQQLSDLLKNSQTVLIATPGTDDAIAAAIGLGEVLGRSGKSVTTVAASGLSGRTQTLPGHERLVSSITKNFIVSLRDAVGNVEKVSYYTEGNDLHLVIHPKPEAPAFTKDKVYYTDSSAGFDLIFVLGAQELVDLGNIYQEEPNLYVKTKIVNVDFHQGNAGFGRINVVETQASSICEQVISILQRLRLELTQEAATAFLLGLEAATANFSSIKVTPEAFEAAATCLRAGGQRTGDKTGIGLPSSQQPSQPPEPQVAQEVKPQVQAMSQKSDQQGRQAGVGKDWLQPKIYKGSQRL
jgi:nanoRNase/pAp phosphatase (c-di-AMP/oligoRNAs hydrolase)